MLMQEEVKKLLTDLVHGEIASIDLAGSTITVKTIDAGKRVSLSTPVYFGGNYIPKSVRNCLKTKAPFESYGIRTSFKIDEENFRIYLKYTEEVQNVSTQRFVDSIEEFSHLANRWRDYLDENDKNDLVYIHAK